MENTAKKLRPFAGLKECAEKRCMMWENNYEECNIKACADSIVDIACKVFDDEEGRRYIGNIVREAVYGGMEDFYNYNDGEDN